MPDNILEILIEKIINNWKKVYGTILGFVVSYGLFKAIIIFAFAFIGYKLADSNFVKRVKKAIINRLKED